MGVNVSSASIYQVDAAFTPAALGADRYLLIAVRSAKQWFLPGVGRNGTGYYAI
jgi:hypothetical protein